RIMHNLLGNAVRYAPPGTRVVVRVRTEGDSVRVEVSDEGPGIPAEHLSRVFERFYRVDPARSREEGGTGLGLAIVKHLVGGHGGEVGIESEVDQGTTVWFTLPVAGRLIP
ncbi:MAG: ATP-binding protein, partial [Gemmatimonadota bacterium]|nr:ATP-binding protein [Gemmatimonadota bacterium]